MKNLRHFILGVFVSALLVLSSYAQLTVLPTGKIDRSFNTDGFLLMADLAPGHGSPAFHGDTIRLSDGKLVWTNTYSMGGHLVIGVIRALPDGQPDPGFGQNGYAYFSFGVNAISHGLVVLQDGKLLVSGSTQQGVDFDDYDSLVFRVNSDGSLDTSFGTGGAFIKDFRETKGRLPSCDNAMSIVALPDGKVLAFGTSESYTNSNEPVDLFSILLRLTSNGAIDTTFGQNGIVRTDIGQGQFSPYALFADPIIRDNEGRILVGLMTSKPNQDFYTYTGEIDRFLEDGTLDTTFGKSGRSILALPQFSFGPAGRMALTRDRHIIFLATSALGRIDSNGVIDSNFGQSGLVFVIHNPTLGGLFVTPDDKIIVTGGDYSAPGTPFRVLGLIARYYSNGMADRRFGTLGRIMIEPPFGSGSGSSFRSLTFGPVFVEDQKHILVQGIRDLTSTFPVRILTRVGISK